MLVLTRKTGQKIRIGDDIIIEVLDVNGDHVKLGLAAPRNDTILREEIYQAVKSQNKDSVLHETKTVALSGLRFDLDLNTQGKNSE